MAKTDLVVGGGVAGLLAAIMLKKKKPEQPVILVEQTSACGGLLQSIKKDNGWEFDYGSHIVAQTGLPELDKILFAGVNKDLWHEMPLLKSGGYFNGQFYEKSHFPVLDHLSKEDLYRVLYQLIECASQTDKEAANLEEHLYKTFGNYLTDHHFAPIMKRQLGVDLHELNEFANKLFGYVRFIAGSADMSRMLKQAPELDNILAFRSYEEGVSSIMNYYPKNGVGIGLWVDDLVRQAESLGVQVKTSTGLESCERDGSCVTQAILSDGSVLEIDEIVWTVPLFLLFKAAGLSFESRYKPTLRQMKLFHFVVDKAFPVDCYHAYCNDPSLRSFRITLYSNIHNGGEANGDHRCTVEMMVDAGESSEELVQVAWKELVQMGLITPDTKALATYYEDLANGFPIFTNAFVAEMQRQHDFAKENLSNIHMLGKASANSFFMNTVLCETYEALK